MPGTGGTGGAADGGGNGGGGNGAGGNGNGGTGGGGNADAGAPDAAGSVIHFDFEGTIDLDGWQVVGSERPPDIVDHVQRSTDAHHHGTSSLAMVFDGAYTPLGASDTPYYGVYTGSNTPPAGAVVSLWVMSTVAGISVQLYAQTKPAYLWQGLAISDPIAANVWTRVIITMPNADSFYFGCLINSAYDISGTIYLDDISW